MIALEDVPLSYGSGADRLLILDAINPRIDAGDFVALVGSYPLGSAFVDVMTTRPSSPAATA